MMTSQPPLQQNGLFSPCRAVGLVCGDVKPYLHSLGTENFIITAVDKSFQVYAASNLALRTVSAPVRKRIRALVAAKDWTFTACGGGVVVWKRSRQIAGFTAHATSIRAMIIVGTTMITASETEIRTWDVDVLCKSEEVVADAALLTTISLPTDFSLTCMVHPPTYVNKVVIGSESGALAVWNVSTCKLKFTSGVCNGAAVTVMEASPAVDVIGVGLADGRILIHNIKLDKTACEFHHSAADEGVASGAVTALSFCTDPLLDPYLLSGCDTGSLAVWNLNSRCLQTLVPLAHEGPVTGVICVPRSNAVITTGSRDNSMKQWVIDAVDGIPKVTRSKVGHSLPPSKLRHFRSSESIGTVLGGADAMACEVVSVGTDSSVRMFHTALDRQNRELSQGNLESIARQKSVLAKQLRAPNVTCIAICDRHVGSIVEGKYADIITGHEGDHRAYTWSYANKSMRKIVLPLPTTDAVVTAVAISTCGTYGLVGGSDGTLLKFNLQSGLNRGWFPASATANPSDWGGVRGGDGKGTKKRPALSSHPLPAPHKDVGKTKGDPNVGAHPSTIDFLFQNVIGVAAKPRGITTADEKAHSDAITGIATDSMNAKVFTVGADGYLRVWDFITHNRVTEVNVGVPVTQLEMARDSGLLALVCEDLTIRVFDAVTLRQVRTFSGHSNRITDASFSVDGRWLLSSSMDCTIRVFDVATGRCIDWMSFPSAPTSLSMAPTNEYLITSHVDSVGLFMWINQAHYTTVFCDTIPSVARPMVLPLPLCDTRDDTVVDSTSDGVIVIDKQPTVTVGPSTDTPATKVLPEPMTGYGVAFSGLPASQWRNLPVMDLIYQRNKPSEPPKEPEKAPFFLPTLPGLAPVFVPPPPKAKEDAKELNQPGKEDDVWASAWVSDGEDDHGTQDTVDVKPQSKLLSNSTFHTPRSRLAQLLTAFQGDSAESTAVLEYLATLPPSKVDVEIRSLHNGVVDAADRVAILKSALQFYQHEFANGRAFELLEAHIGLFLKVWGDVIMDHPELQAVCKEVLQSHKSRWTKLQALMQHNLCLIQHFTNIQ